MSERTVFVLKNSLGHYWSKDNDSRFYKVPRTTRHFTDAKMWLHTNINFESFKYYKVSIKETIHET